MDTKLCQVCNEIKPLNKFKLNEDGSIRRHVCTACHGRRTRAKLKLEALEALGKVCVCCGETHPYFLTLDHINNDGNIEREKYGQAMIYKIAKKLGWPKDKYQLLCWNCNLAKAMFGECPHKVGISTEEGYKQIELNVFKGENNIVQARQIRSDKSLQRKAEEILDNLTQDELLQLINGLK